MSDWDCPLAAASGQINADGEIARGGSFAGFAQIGGGTMNRENEFDERKTMDCPEFREVLHELDRPGTRGAAAFDSAMAHAEGCGDCGVLLVEEESLGFALQQT